MFRFPEIVLIYFYFPQIEILNCGKAKKKERMGISVLRDIRLKVKII
jgi:hypothetical protein